MNALSTQLAFDKYITVKELVNKQKCFDLSEKMKEGFAAKNIDARKDSQCPKSEAVYGASFFDRLLVDLLPTVASVSGKRLYPTYSYARCYMPFEELKIHTDRPACEISVTLTLGYDGYVWPIYMGDANGANAAKLEIDVGDAVVYMGAEKHHWREIYTEGNWQTQVFLHYVDADGPHKEWKFDKFPCLNLLD